MEGFCDEVIVAALVAWVIDWFSIAEVLPWFDVSPLYPAVSGYRSALRFDLVKVATPLLLSVAEPMV